MPRHPKAPPPTNCPECYHPFTSAQPLSEEIEGKLWEGAQFQCADGHTWTRPLAWLDPLLVHVLGL